MTTKRASKKSSTKKSATKKRTSKRASAKQAQALPINLKCIVACVERYHRCLQKGVDQKTCQKRLARCIGNCTAGIFPTDE